MNWNQVHECEWLYKRWGLAASFFPYQIAFGVSLRYLRCNGSLLFRLYLGPVKIWGYMPFLSFKISGANK